MAISRMQNPQQLQGIGSLRQPYGFGRFVKKIGRGIKKVAKSKIGKAALMYAATAGLGALAGGASAGSTGFGWKMFNPASMARNFGTLSRFLPGAGAMPGNLMGSTGGGGIGKFFKSGMGKWINPMSGAFGAGNKWKHAAGLAGVGMIASPFIQKALGYGPYQEVEEEVDDWTQTPESILKIRNMAKARDPSLAFMPSRDYVKGFYNAADGGRAGLLNGGEAGEAQMEQMLRAEYIKYRNQGGTMPYEQFKILVMKQAQQGQAPNQMMAAQGGRIGYSEGSWDAEWDDLYENYKVKQIELGQEFVSKEEFIEQYQDSMASGGRAGYQGGELVEQQTDLIEGPQGGEEFQETVVEGQEQPSREQLEALAMEIFQLPLEELDEQQLLVVYQEAMQGQPMEETVQEEDVQFADKGGRIGYQRGGDDDEDVLNQSRAMAMYRTRRQEGGLMDLGGMEKDYRQEGGFVPLGGEEKADDVPARLSKNEFVFTADAVRAAGGGDVDAGSEVMQNVMDNLEQGGEVSEDSQGLEGGEEIMSEEIIDESNPAQGMYDNYEQLQSRIE